MLIMSSEAKMPDHSPARTCGDCSLCCKLAQVEVLDKPAGVWCRHCAPGRGGCTIYETRPETCRNWACSWIVDSRIGPEWYPLTSKMILFFENAGSRLCVRVEPSHADVWRREPYYSQLKQWSREAVQNRQQIVVFIKKRVIVILPDKDVDFGDVELGEQIWVGAQDTPTGRTWSAAKIPADVPPEHVDAWLRSHVAR
jgi:Fe-S-cluster containining protein